MCTFEGFARCLDYRNISSSLTHCPLGDLTVISNLCFLNSLHWLIPWGLHLICSQLNTMEPHWCHVSIGSGDGLVPSGTKPLTEWLLTQIYVAIWRHRGWYVESPYKTLQMLYRKGNLGFTWWHDTGPFCDYTLLVFNIFSHMNWVFDTSG